jgi:hypothetical protein
MAPFGFVLAASAGGLMGVIGAAAAPEWAKVFPAPRARRPW